MSQKFCKTCGHYRQHYALNKKSLFEVYCGHCVLQRVQKRKPDQSACEQYVSAQPDTEAFATKEYLSKELVQYLINLELLPPIYTLENL